MANVLITGCSSGFGLLTALEFARKGDHVFATMRNTAKAGELEKIRDSEKLPIDILQLDILDQTSVDRAVAAAGQIDVLVNNAGMELRSPIEDASEAEIRKQFETNVFGTLRVIHAVLPSMRERRSGTIVNLSSVTGIIGVPYGGYYAATKHALEAITETMHFELSSFGVRMISIEPGAFHTEFGNNTFSAARFNESSAYWGLSERFTAARTKLNPAEGVPADPADVARAIYNAVHDETPRLRYLVGADAQLIGAVRKQTDFEGFEAAMRQTLDWRD